MKNKTIIFGILLILIGFSVTYFLGYKDSDLLGMISYLTFFFGWLIVIFSIFGKFYTFNKSKFFSNKFLWLKQTIKNTGIITLSIVGIIVSIIVTGHITEKRIQKILYTQPNDETIAEVIDLESRYTRGGWKIWAIFRYKTSANEIYQKEIFNDGNQFQKGDQYKILYSIKYPEIIELESKVE